MGDVVVKTQGPSHRRPKSRFRSCRGQSLVELALIAPVLIILALGIIDYGRVYFAYVSVTNGARTGADYASTDATAAADLSGIEAAALAETSNLLDQSPTNPDVVVATGTDAQGYSYADVTFSYTFETIFPWPGLPDSFNVERTVRTRVAE
jgi:Flp pilus assembly protein TadG